MEAEKRMKQKIMLENRRVQLIPLTLSHLKDLLPIALEPGLWQFSPINITNERLLNEYLAFALKEKEEGKAYPFVIIDKRTDEIVGCTRFYDIQPKHKTLEIGYTWISKAVQGTDLNKACKYELLKFAFEDLKYNRVALRTDYLNHQSRHAIQKIGAKQEGILRQHIITDSGRIRDTVYFSIIQEEWALIRKTIFAEYL